MIISMGFARERVLEKAFSTYVRYIEVQKEVSICFFDYEKAFERVYHDEIMECLEMIEI